MTIHEAQQQLLFQLYELYDNSEAAQIADMVLENITGWSRIDRVMNKTLPLLPQNVAKFDQFTRELMEHRPVQYVLNESWFAGMKLFVDERVLIPRPETEELVDWIVKELKGDNEEGEGYLILDIGTGSGCIPLALKKNLPAASVSAIDISEGALEVARKNAGIQNLYIDFRLIDILSLTQTKPLPRYDLIVSNPPYIPLRDRETMRKNVLDYEPWQALFVKDDDPFVFYRAIAQFASSHLKPGGKIFVEIHEDLVEGVLGVFKTEGFVHSQLKADMQGKNRMLKLY